MWIPKPTCKATYLLLSLAISLNLGCFHDAGWARVKSRGLEKANAPHSVELFLDVVEANARLKDDIRRAAKPENLDAEIWISMWSWSEAFLLDDKGLTLLDELKTAMLQNPKLKVYVLLWAMPKGTKLVVNLGWQPFNEGKALADWPESVRERFVVAKQSLFWTHPLSSAHQKFVLFKFGGESVGYCLDYNFQNFHFDYSDHDAMRRIEMKLKLPPVHDTAIRFRGAAIADLQNEFLRRWRKTNKRKLAPTSSFPVPGQTGTMPLLQVCIQEPGNKSNGIKNWYLNAIKNAKHFIYLESQYFDDPDVADALIQAYFRGLSEAQPNIVFSICSPETVEPRNQIDGSMRQAMKVRMATAEEIELKSGKVIKRHGQWKKVIVDNHARDCRLQGDGFDGKIKFKDIRSIRGGVRFITMITRSVNESDRFQPIYVHSKLGWIDNKLTIGSANQNKRSFGRDYEANVMVTESDGADDVLRFGTRLMNSHIDKDVTGSTLLQRLDNTATKNFERRIRSSADGPVGLVIEYPYLKMPATRMTPKSPSIRMDPELKH